MDMNLRHKFIAGIAGILTLLSLTGCKATQSYNAAPYKEAGYSALPFGVTVEPDFQKLHVQIATKFKQSGVNTLSYDVSSDNGDVDVIEVPMPNDWLWKPHVFRNDRLLKLVIERSCSRSVIMDSGQSGDSKMSFAGLFRNSGVDISSYGASEADAKVFNKQYISKAPSSKVYHQLVSPLFDHIKQTRPSLRLRSKAHLVYVCISDGQVSSALMLNEIYGYENSEVSRNSLFVSHYDSEFFDNLLADASKKLVQWANKNQDRKDAAKQKENEKRVFVQEIKASHKELWDSRLDANYEIGDRICSYNNLVGNIEQQSGKRLKVLWTRELVETDGYFFGEVPINKYDEDLNKFAFNFKYIERLDWVDKSLVAKCTIDVE